MIKKKNIPHFVGPSSPYDRPQTNLLSSLIDSIGDHYPLGYLFNDLYVSGSLRDELIMPRADPVVPPTLISWPHNSPFLTPSAVT